MSLPKKISSLLSSYQSLGLSDVIDYTKFNLYSITHHSTNIEGSTLSEIETQLLLDEDLTPQGKPLSHSLMTKDHFKALQFVLQQAEQKATINEQFIKTINALVLKNTGSTYHTILGIVDSSKGEYRLANVRAGSRYFVNYAKVAKLTKSLANALQEKMEKAKTKEEQLLLSFDAHFDLVSIHPFYDGNGRTARLLMNYIQRYFELPLALVFKEDKVAYFEALEATRNQEEMSPFRDFMFSQYAKHLSLEIEKYKSLDKGKDKSGFSLIF